MNEFTHSLTHSIAHLLAHSLTYIQLSTFLQTVISPVFVFSDKCLQANGGCSHQCSVAPSRGVVCSCPNGLYLASDNKSCEVVDYCTRHLKCSQRCEQFKTTVKCSCYPGWRLNPDGESCHSTGTSVHIPHLKSTVS